MKKSSRGSLSDHAHVLSQRIFDYYMQYLDKFRTTTTLAKERFEKRQWQEGRKDTQERLDLYERTLGGVARLIRAEYGQDAAEEHFWRVVKKSFALLVSDRCDSEMARTFYNSVTRKILETAGVNRKVEFFHIKELRRQNPDCYSVVRKYVVDRITPSVVKQILLDYKLDAPFEDLERDVTLAAGEVALYLWPMLKDTRLESIEMVSSPFFRNKVAYIVGRCRIDHLLIPLVMPLYNGERGIYVDATLFRERQVETVFGFAHTYFRVDVPDYGGLIEFLHSILPDKPVAELYFTVGRTKHGKTAFYRDLHTFIHTSKKRFEIAPGREGSVMIGFTLPGYDFVFKVIKDRACYLRSNETATKLLNREFVMQRYQWVCHSDRVGRMVDTQEFEKLRFRIQRFSPALLKEFRTAATTSVSIDSDFVTINHLYLQRKVVPLPFYLRHEQDPEMVRRVIIDYGQFLKDLAAIGVFPTDLFNVWNCGVTPWGRVVLFDYDDVEPLNEITFHDKPRTHLEELELLPEDEQITASPSDFFMDEIERYLGVPEPLRAVFDQAHGDLYTVRFWRHLQRRVRRGEIIDIIPYDRARRFDQKRSG